MLFARYLILILAILIAAGATVWLLANGGPATLAAALPAFLIAAVALRYLRG